jgi:hypothetical protein
MTQAVAKFAAKKLLSKEMDKYRNKEPAGPYVSVPLFSNLFSNLIEYRVESR